MYTFLSTIEPRTNRADKNMPYQKGLQRAFRNVYPNAGVLEGDLYAASYYFHRRKTQIDADNLSKPILDSLNGLAYEDDFQIKVRYSGTFDLGRPVGVLDLDQIPQPTLQQLLGFLESNQRHVLYVEIGRLHYEHFRFGNEVSP